MIIKEAHKILFMKDKPLNKCKKCGADIEETYTTRYCQGCGLEEQDCDCEN